MDYGQHYSDESFTAKLKRLTGRATGEVMDKAVTLYVLLKASSTPTWARAAILAALGYFIFPLDAVPDFLPVGFIDDMAVMSAVLANLSRYQTEETKAEKDRIRLRFS